MKFTITIPIVINIPKALEDEVDQIAEEIDATLLDGQSISWTGENEKDYDIEITTGIPTAVQS